jgi:sugar fermentation stimulation protein A
MRFEFLQHLAEGLILKRKNRFIMEVLLNGKIEICHCPCTGRIGNVVFENIPCLLTNTNNIKTKYTIEAVSLNNIDDPNKKWIGINQIKANKYVEFFLKNNQLPKIIKTNKKSIISRERVVGKSKLDFLINNEIRIEVKTPLIILPLKNSYITNKNLKFKENNSPISTDRFLKHLNELAISSANKHKSILICFYMFEAEPFVPPKKQDNNIDIHNGVKNSLDSGVEMWQVNCKFSEDYIKLVDYYPLNSGISD